MRIKMARPAIGPSCRVLLRHSLRASSTLRLLQPQSTGCNDMPTIYVTGFLTETASSENYRAWINSHLKLQTSLGWSDEVYGVSWSNGGPSDGFGRLPVPLHLAVLMMRRSSPAALMAGLAGDMSLNSARLYLKYRDAEQAAERDAPRVASSLYDLATDLQQRDGSSGSGFKYRIVAHSLGCRLLMEALPTLPDDAKPAEVHLCAAAVTPSLATSKLLQLPMPGGHVYHHWSDADEALLSGFLLASSGERALGSSPLPAALPPPATPGVLRPTASSHDASGHLGIASHGAYSEQFHRLATDGTHAQPALNSPSTSAKALTPGKTDMSMINPMCNHRTFDSGDRVSRSYLYLNSRPRSPAASTAAVAHGRVHTRRRGAHTLSAALVGLPVGRIISGVGGSSPSRGIRRLV